MKTSYLFITVLVIVSIISLVSGQYQSSSGLSPISYLSDDQRRDILQQLMARKNDFRNTDASAIPANDQSAEYATIMGQKRAVQDQLLSNQNQGFQSYAQNAVTEAINPQDLLVTEAINPQDLLVTEAIDPRSQQQSAFDAIRQHDSQYYGVQEQGTDQAEQYAQIMSQGFQQQPAQVEQDTDQAIEFTQIMQNNMNNKPQDNPVETESVDTYSQASYAITPAITPGSQQQQYGRSIGSNAYYGPQEVVQNTDQTAEYAYMEANKNAQRAQLEQPVQQDTNNLYSGNVYQQEVQQQQQQMEGYDQSNLYQEIMIKKGIKQSRLEQPVEQPSIEAPGLSQAIDPRQQPQQNIPTQSRSWEVLNAVPYYIPQQQQANSWQSSSARSFSSLNTQQDQTSDYIAIMAQQRAYQQALQQQQY